MESVGKRIKELRLAENLTQREVAEMLNIDRSNYSKYENGKLELSNRLLVKLAGFYEVTTDYLLGLEN